MEADTGATAADIVAALRAHGIEIEVTEATWDVCLQLRYLFNKQLHP